MTKRHAFAIDRTRPRAAAIDTLRPALTVEQMGIVSRCNLSDGTAGSTHSALQDPPVIADASDNPDVRAASDLASAA